MKLKALDQVHISSVKRDAIAAGETFEVSDDMAKQLMEKNPALFAKVSDAKAEKAAASPQTDRSDDEAEKAEAAPQNKAEDAPANKADTRRKAKS